MKNTKIFSVTVGISAFNEEKNIGHLLRSILRQKGEGYILEHIIILDDGSTDNTEKKVRTLSKRHTKISLISDGKRMGKKQRLMQLYELNKSDIIISFDADTILADPFVIERMVNHFESESVVYVGANGKPVQAKTLVEKLINTWDLLWYDAIKDIQNGNNIYNVHGFGIALRKQFAKTVIFPKEITAEARILYFIALQRNLSFRFAQNAFIAYRSPSSIQEYIWRIHRSPDQHQKLFEAFGRLVSEEYDIVPLKNKLKAFITILFRKPINTILAAIFELIAYHYPWNKNFLDQNGFWKSLPSTKIV